jgi:16S rRNA (cytosine1402-N4)-methyltransferase
VVKKVFDSFKKDGKGIAITKKPIIATFDETSKNKRSRSAKMRVFEKK